MKRLVLTLVSCFFLLLTVDAQRQITGTVSAEEEGPLIGATVQIRGSSIGTITDLEGNFTLNVPVDTRELLVSFIGYGSIVVQLDDSDYYPIVLSSGEILNEIVIVGSRSAGRTKLETAVPVDVLNIKELANNSPQMTVNALLNYVAPSFTSNTQTISDGTDHIDPASLRGLGPDQVLVLINGKRRHSTSLVNVNGTFGRGNVGTDMNAIPVAAIERIEILRDGAAAQYGSDAIAGVINIVLKDDYGLNFAVGTGAHFSSEIPEPDGSRDGEMLQLSANYGTPIGDKGGFFNMTGSFEDRQHTNRMKEWEGQIFAGYNNPDYQGDPSDDITDSELQARGLVRSDFNMRVGQSDLRNGGIFFNSEVPINNSAELYAFGGLNYRRGLATGFYRLPFQQRTVTDIYPNGFLPEINSNIVDKSIAVGMRSRIGDWEVDLSNVWGSNSFSFFITNTNNASLEARSPTSFDAGGFSFSQNTANLDIHQYFDDVMAGLNIAFGAEYRLENYQINAGEEGSYTNYGLASWLVTENGDSLLVNDNQGPVNTVFGPNGSARPGGSQVFPGFSPDNALDRFRNSVAFYADLEADLTEDFLVGIAGRFEEYSDFGSTLNGKLALRYRVGDNLSVRAAGSTGFRAPSLHQLYFNTTSTNFIDGIPFEIGTFSNDSRPAQLLGIDPLKEETSVSISAGITGQIPNANLTVTIDGYIVNIDDRVILTGQFSGDDSPDASDQDKEIAALLRQANAQSARFFANAIDTETRGLDVVITHNANIGNGKLMTSLAGNFNQTVLGEVKTNDLLKGKEDIYFDRTNQIFLESAVPMTKVNLTFNYSVGDLGIMLRNVYFGEVEEATNNADNAQVFGAKIITDLSLSYRFFDNWNISIGANNLLDVYPDMNIEANRSGGRFLYSRRSQQFGFNGRFLFARLRFDL